jgi:glucan biosynthesis protein
MLAPPTRSPAATALYCLPHSQSDYIKVPEFLYKNIVETKMKNFEERVRVRDQMKKLRYKKIGMVFQSGVNMKLIKGYKQRMEKYDLKGFTYGQVKEIIQQMDSSMTEFTKYVRSKRRNDMKIILQFLLQTNFQ